MKRLAFAITLVLVFIGSAMAQSARPDPGYWPGFSLSVSNLNGLEASPGTLDYVDELCWGRTFVMKSDGSSFTFVPNYYFDPKIGGEPTEYITKIIGGSWTMVYKSGKQSGMLFGEMAGGTIEWYMDKEGNAYAIIDAQMVIRGGTESFGNVGGPHTSGTFKGRVDLAPRGIPVIQGSVDLMF
jgi:hypothetical protein